MLGVLALAVFAAPANESGLFAAPFNSSSYGPENGTDTAVNSTQQLQEPQQNATEEINQTQRLFDEQMKQFGQYWNRTRMHLAAFTLAASIRLRTLGRLLLEKSAEYMRALARQLLVTLSEARTALILFAQSQRDALIVWAQNQWDATVSEAQRHRRALIDEWKRFRRRDPAVSRILKHAAASDWYTLLQVRRKANDKQLRGAYRKLAKRVHPDKTRDDRAARAFDVLRDTYDLLNDERKRKRFDEQLAERDRQARLRREQRRRMAMRTAVRTVRSASIAMWEHKRVTAGIALVLYLRFGLAAPADPAQQALPAVQQGLELPVA